MGMCKNCGEVYSALYMKDGICETCYEVGYKAKEPQCEEEMLEQRKVLTLKKYTSMVMITTESTLTDTTGKNMVKERLGIVTSERINGINIMKDLFSFVRDIVGGRIESLEVPLNTTKKEAIEELQREAYLLGATAVIGVTVEHTYNNANNGSIMSVSAIGTAVLLVENKKVSNVENTL